MPPDREKKKTTKSSAGRPKTRPVGAKRREVSWMTDEQYEILTQFGNGDFSKGVRMIADSLRERVKENENNEKRLAVVRPV